MNSFEITFVKGMNWPKADPVGWCDPYCLFTFEGKEFKTKHDTNTSEPKWEESFIVTASSEPLQIDCYDWDRVGDDDLLGKFYINFEDFSDLTTNKNIKFDITLEEEYLSKKKIEEKPSVVVLNITNVEKRKKEEEERIKREEEERKKIEFMEANARKEAMGECKKQLKEYSEEVLKDKFRPIHISLMKWTQLNDYRLLYTSDVEELSGNELNKVVANNENVMLLVIDEIGHLFGLFAKKIVDSQCPDNDYFLFSIKGFKGVSMCQFHPKTTSECPVSIGGENNVVFSVKNAFTIRPNNQSSIDPAINEHFTSSISFDGTTFVGKVEPEKFNVRCVFALQWH